MCKPNLKGAFPQMETTEGFQREQFTFYRSYWKALEHMCKRDRLALYEAFIALGLDGTEPENLTPRQQGIFEMARPNLMSGRRKAFKAILRQAEENLMNFNPDTED